MSKTSPTDHPYEPWPLRRKTATALREWYDTEVAHIAEGELYSEHVHPIDLMRRRRSRKTWLRSGLAAYRLITDWAVADGLPVQPQLTIGLPTAERINANVRCPSRKRAERLVRSGRFHSPPYLVLRSWRALGKPYRSRALHVDLGWQFPEVGEPAAHEFVHTQFEFPGPPHWFVRSIEIRYVTTDLDVTVTPPPSAA